MGDFLLKCCGGTRHASSSSYSGRKPYPIPFKDPTKFKNGFPIIETSGQPYCLEPCYVQWGPAPPGSPTGGVVEGVSVFPPPPRYRVRTADALAVCGLPRPTNCTELIDMRDPRSASATRIAPESRRPPTPLMIEGPIPTDFHPTSLRIGSVSGPVVMGNGMYLTPYMPQLVSMMVDAVPMVQPSDYIQYLDFATHKSVIYDSTPPHYPSFEDLAAERRQRNIWNEDDMFNHHVHRSAAAQTDVDQNDQSVQTVNSDDLVSPLSHSNAETQTPSAKDITPPIIELTTPEPDPPPVPQPGPSASAYESEDRGSHEERGDYGGSPMAGRRLSTDVKKRTTPSPKTAKRTTSPRLGHYATPLKRDIAALKEAEEARRYRESRYVSPWKPG